MNPTRRRHRLQGIFALATLIAAPALAQQKPPADRRNFLACPVVRDTKTVPCFLAEFEGELYFLGIQEDTGAAWYPPQLGHKVLVEGTVSNEPRVCGGIVLKPVVTSVMPELEPSCNTMLPAEEGIEAPHAPRGPGPSSVRPGAAPAPAAVPAPLTPPFAVRTYTLPFDFDSDFMPGRVTRIVNDALRYVRETGAARVEVTTYRGASLLSTGETLRESPVVVARRAKKLETILLGLGVPASALSVTIRSEPEAADGIGDVGRRRATIVVRPAGTAP